MYSTRSGLILGFHGCDETVAKEVIEEGGSLKPSTNDWDWLGTGIYFWEQSPERALHFAQELRDNPGRSKKPIENPAVVGAVLDLGFCLDLVHMDNLNLLKNSYNTLKVAYEELDWALPKNTGQDPKTQDLLARNLDCLVINAVHNVRALAEEPSFDSVRGVFWEGKELYPTAGFRAKNHIQVAIRNTNCIKGYFRPRKLDSKHPKV